MSSKSQVQIPLRMKFVLICSRLNVKSRTSHLPDKLKNALASWKAHTLSWAGRAVLIDSVLTEFHELASNPKIHYKYVRLHHKKILGEEKNFELNGIS